MWWCAAKIAVLHVTRHGKPLLVNPGEIWGYLIGHSSVAIKRFSDEKIQARSRKAS